MGTPRAEVVAVLTAALPAAVTVIPYARNIDVAGQGTVMVRVDEVTPSPQPQALREYKFALVLVVEQTVTGDDDLDALLEDVLHALESRDVPNGIVWTTVTRATFEEKFPAYQVNLTVHFGTTTKE